MPESTTIAGPKTRRFFSLAASTALWHRRKDSAGAAVILSGQKQVAGNHQNYAGENAPEGIVVNYYLKDKVPEGVSVQVYKGARPINEYRGSGDPGLNSVEWYLTERIPVRKKGKKKRPGGSREQKMNSCFSIITTGMTISASPAKKSP